MRKHISAFSGRIIFDHLPKCAGTAINKWLTDILGNGCVTQSLIGSHRDIIKNYGGEYSVLSGHLEFSNYEGLDPLYKYFTCLREPVDRTLSALFFALNHLPPTASNYELKKGAKLFIESDGNDTTKEFYYFIYNPAVIHFCSINGDINDSPKLQLANSISTIKEYDVIGFFENLEQFRSDIASFIGFEFQSNFKRVNVTSGRPSTNKISKCLLNRINELNKLDIEFYQEILSWKASTLDSIDTDVNNKPTNIKFDKYEKITLSEVSSQELFISSAEVREGYTISFGQFVNVDFEVLCTRKLAEPIVSFKMHCKSSNSPIVCKKILLNPNYDLLSNNSFNITCHFIANLTPDIYSISLNFSERSSSGDIIQLANFESLSMFEVSTASGIHLPNFVNFPFEVSLHTTKNNITNLIIFDAKGTLKTSHSLKSLNKGSLSKLHVIITNSSTQNWIGSCQYPLNISYHWLNNLSNERVVSEGIRTPLPDSGISTGNSFETDILVESPQIAGSYTLVLTLVQETVCWFENRGFDPAHLKIDVLP